MCEVITKVDRPLVPNRSLEDMADDQSEGAGKQALAPDVLAARLQVIIRHDNRQHLGPSASPGYRLDSIPDLCVDKVIGAC